MIQKICSLLGLNRCKQPRFDEKQFKYINPNLPSITPIKGNHKPIPMVPPLDASKTPTVFATPVKRHYKR